MTNAMSASGNEMTMRCLMEASFIIMEIEEQKSASEKP